MSEGAGEADRVLYYEEKGEGVPILLIHPAGATTSMWDAVVTELAAAGRVIVYDRRGYARSGGEPVLSISTHTVDAAALLDRLGLSAAVVTGTSVGATIAIDLARLRPDLVRAVVAHESPWHVTRQPPTPSEVVALSKMAWLSSRHRYPEAAAAFLRFAYSYRDGGSAWDRFPDEWRQTVTDNAQAALADIRIAIGNYPTAGELSGIQSPVVCTCGSRSASKMVRVARKLAGVIPTGVFCQIDTAGHSAPFDAPGTFAKVITDSITAA
jgi:pimeloyl-ACP methyl ester carboxylesterase